MATPVVTSLYSLGHTEATEADEECPFGARQYRHTYSSLPLAETVPSWEDSLNQTDSDCFSQTADPVCLVTMCHRCLTLPVQTTSPSMYMGTCWEERNKVADVIWGIIKLTVCA